MSSRIAASWCWYHGGPFRGYQSQARGPTVQDAIGRAMAANGIEGQPVASGRTDLGVHARMQVVSFRVESIDGLADRLNAHLPPGVGIACAAEAPPKFSAQWKASGKEYRYRLALDDDPAWKPFAWRTEVDRARLEAVLQHAVGTHDFIAFHEKSSARALRTISSIKVNQPAPQRLDVQIIGSGFGRYQVRYLVGGAVAVARGETREEDYVAGIERQVEFAGTKAPAEGLVLWQVFYPPAFDPFPAAVRLAAAGVPRGPPFHDG